jgi:hypothetical protein
VGHSGQKIAILNNLAIALCISLGMDNLAKARRFLMPFSDRALTLLTCDKLPSFVKAVHCLYGVLKVGAPIHLNLPQGHWGRGCAKNRYIRS